MANQKVFIPLENNPVVMSDLAHKLGLSTDLNFHDVYSLTDKDLLGLVPRPAQALLFIYPKQVPCNLSIQGTTLTTDISTDSAQKFYEEDYAQEADYDGSGDEPILFYRQRITHACGLIGLLHCITNPTRSFIAPGSELDKLMQQAKPLKPEARARLLHDSDVLEAAHDAAAHNGQSFPPERGDCPPQAFIAFVKGSDGHLYELEGRRKGPIDRGLLPQDADMLSNEALDAGPLPFVRREEEAGGNCMFSCIVLA